MPCPHCGYAMSAFETDCPRCAATPRKAVLTPEPIPTTPKPFPGEIYLCRRCGAVNAPTDRACETCGETIGYDNIMDAFKDKGVRQAALESAVMFAVVLLCLQVFTHFSNILQGTVIISTVAVLAWRFLRALEGRRG